MMKKTIGFSVLAMTIIISGCQTTAHEFNGKSGYQVIEKTSSTASMNYILSGQAKYDHSKLQASCKSVLGADKNYTVNVLNTQEIANTAVGAVEYGRPIGNSRTNISLSNTPDLYNSDNLATRDALDVQPALLRAIRYNCS
jgi:hypothetical protein